MSNTVGYTIIAGYGLLFTLLLVVRHFLGKYPTNYRLLKGVLEWISVFIPVLMLFSLGDKWVFGIKYLPSQDPNDLTFSTFHLFAIALSIGGGLFLLNRVPRDLRSNQTYFGGRLNRVDYQILKFGVMLLSIELFKQIVHLGLFTQHYEWRGFPLQFCSLPLYLYTTAPFYKNKTWKNRFYDYFAIYSHLGGLSVLFTGGGVFNLDVSLSIHTLLWHGSMVAVGIYLISVQKIGNDWRQYIDTTVMMLISVVFIQVVNMIFHFISLGYPAIAGFDGFYLNPWSTNNSILYISDVRASLVASGVPMLFVLLTISLIYGIGVSLGGFIIFYMARKFKGRDKIVLIPDAGAENKEAEYGNH